MNRFALVVAVLLCSPAFAQANPAPTTKELPAVTVDAPKKTETAGKFSKCDLECRMAVIAATLEKMDCRKDGFGFKDKAGQAMIMKIPTRDALEARIEELCKEFIDRADKIAEDLKLDEPAAAEVDTKPASKKIAGVYGRDARYDKEPILDRGPTFGRGSQFGGRGRPHSGKRRGEPKCPHGMHMTSLGLCGVKVMATPAIKAQYNAGSGTLCAWHYPGAGHQSAGRHQARGPSDLSSLKTKEKRTHFSGATKE
jgi:hypothetical protein